MRIQIKTIVISMIMVFNGAASANDASINETVQSSKINNTILKSASSIQLIKSQDLNNANVQSTDELAKVAHGLNFAVRGTRIYSQFGMRGVPSIDYYSPAVSVYVDDVAQDMAFFTQPMFAISHVEVRKGPQGTLYGSGAQAGSIHIYSQPPDNRRKFYSLLDIGKDRYSAGLNAKAAVVTDKLFTDVGIYFAHKNGSLKNIKTHQTGLDDSDENLFKIKLSYLPKDNLEFKLSYINSVYKSHEEYYQEYEPKDDNAIANTAFDLTEPNLKRKIQNTSLLVNYYAENWKLTAISAFQQRKFDRTLFSANRDPENQDTKSFELRASSDYAKNDAHLFDFVTGIYLEEQQFERIRRVVSAKVPEFLFAGDSQANIENVNHALFADGTMHWKNVSLGIGARYDRFKNSINYNRVGAKALTFYKDNQYNHLTKKLSIAWQPDENINVYGLYSEGFKAGGFNRTADNIGQNIAYNPEKSSMVELGIKLYENNLKLGMDAAVYAGKTQDMQQQLLAGAYQVLKNMGDAKTSGLELNINTQKIQNLELNLAIALNNSEIENNQKDALNANINGNQVPNISPIAYQLSALYKFTFDKLLGNFAFRLAAKGSSATYLDAQNSLVQNSHVIYDSMFNWQYQNYQIKAYIDNINNTRYRTYAFYLGPSKYAQFNQARNYGVSLGVDF